MGKEILCLAILKLKKINITAIRFLFLGIMLDIEKVLVSNKISFGEKNLVLYWFTCISKPKYFIGYLYKGNKVKHYIKCFLKQVLM